MITSQKKSKKNIEHDFETMNKIYKAINFNTNQRSGKKKAA
jgi:hypothetical protein